VITKVLSPVLHGVAGLIFPATGRHRQQPVRLLDERFPGPSEPVRRAVLDEADLVQLLDAEQIVANESADCSACERKTFHAMNRDGSRRCWTCSTLTVPGGDS
jgi:hypothetical protein